MKLKERLNGGTREELEEIERLLREKRARLREAAQGIMNACLTIEASRSADSGEWATETLHDDIQVAFLDSVNLHLGQIEAALGRLAHGKHGLCHECGMFIGLARLRAIPFALWCPACHLRTELQVSQAGKEIKTRLPSSPERIGGTDNGV